MNCSVFALLAALAAQAAAAPPIVKSPVVAVTAGQAWPIKEGDVVLKDFAFRSGESLPELRMHYTTLGAPHRNAAGVIDNAVMVLHSSSCVHNSPTSCTARDSRSTSANIGSSFRTISGTGNRRSLRMACG